MKLREREKIIVQAKMHWNSYGPASALVIIALFMGITNKAGAGTLFKIAAVSFIPLLITIFRNHFRKFIVTNERFYIEDGVLSKLKTDLPLSKINDVQLRQSFIQRLLNSGDLVVMTGNDAKVKIKDIENAEEFREALAKRAA